MPLGMLRVQATLARRLAAAAPRACKAGSPVAADGMQDLREARERIGWHTSELLLAGISLTVALCVLARLAVALWRIRRAGCSWCALLAYSRVRHCERGVHTVAHGR